MNEGGDSIIAGIIGDASTRSLTNTTDRFFFFYFNFFSFQVDHCVLPVGRSTKKKKAASR